MPNGSTAVPTVSLAFAGDLTVRCVDLLPLYPSLSLFFSILCARYTQSMIRAPCISIGRKRNLLHGKKRQTCTIFKPKSIATFQIQGKLIYFLFLFPFENVNGIEFGRFPVNKFGYEMLPSIFCSGQTEGVEGLLERIVEI